MNTTEVDALVHSVIVHLGLPFAVLSVVCLPQGGTSRPVRMYGPPPIVKQPYPEETVRANVSGLCVKRSPLRATMESGAGPSSLNSRSSC